MLTFLSQVALQWRTLAEHLRETLRAEPHNPVEQSLQVVDFQVGPEQ